LTPSSAGRALGRERRAREGASESHKEKGNAGPRCVADNFVSAMSAKG